MGSDESRYGHEVADFVNDPIGVSTLPRLDNDNFEVVDPNWLRVSLIGIGLFATAVVASGGVLLLLLDFSWVLLVAVVGLLVASGLIAMGRVLEVRHIAYQVRQHDLSYRSGVLTKRVSTVPFVRVQHARIRQGPVQRRFGLATLEINSAGPDLRIQGLAGDTADRLKALVVERAGDLAEDS